MTHNLPAALSSFVGRHDEMAAVTKLVDGARLVTLIGPAGVGKTRLAVTVAGAAEADLDEIRLVELAPVADPSLVAAAVAAALHVHEQPGRPMIEALIDHLCDRRLLLVLDNCEHVVGAAATLADALLARCPSLRILATSREPLGVAGEAVWPVPPLPVPPGLDAWRGGDQWSGDGPGAYEAVRLFVERATATDPSFALIPAVAPAVAEICRRLDGMPLAIELAAARASVLGPAEIAERLDDRFRLLTGGSRTVARRHQSLQAALEWSYDLLCDRERVLLARLSVFAGSFTVEGAEEVCAGEDIRADQILPLLTGLVRKSLTVADTSAEQARYRLLETIRHFGADKLVAFNEAQVVADRHGAYYTKLAEAAELELTGRDQDVWIERLETEHANLRVALRWSLTAGQPERALRLAAALALFWSVRGHLREGRAWLEGALAAAPDAGPTLRAKALWALGWVAGSADDFAAAVAAGSESLALYRELGDSRGTARALQVVGICTLVHDPARGRPLVDESMAVARRAEDRWCLTRSLALLGLIETFRGELVAARAALEECVPLARAGHDKLTLCLGLLGLGLVAFGAGDHTAAEVLTHEGLAVGRTLENPRWEGQGVLVLGALAQVRGDYARARQLLEDSLVLSRKGGSPWTAATALWRLGLLARDGCAPDAASSLFAEALSLARTAGSNAHAVAALLEMDELPRASADLAGASVRIEEALSLAREYGADHFIAWGLHHRGSLARLQGDYSRAETSHHEALRLWDGIGQRVCLAICLEALGGLAAEQGRGEHAARLLSAASSFLGATGYVRPPADQASYEADLASARQGLSPEAFASAWEQGRRLSLQEAVACAAKGSGPRRRPKSGWASLTNAERDVALLAAQGLTNTEIGRQLFVSPHTVKAHLAHIFPKLSVTSRRQLTRKAGQEPGPAPQVA